MNAWGIDMTPTKEQLADPKYWDENAPEGATHWVGPTVYPWEKHEDDKRFVWISNNWLADDNGELNLEPVEDFDYCIPRPTQPQWAGEGLPPVGVECEGLHAVEGADWFKCKVNAYSDDIGKVWLTEYFGNGFTLERDFVLNVEDLSFRPIRTQAEIEREEVVESARDYLGKIGAARPSNVLNALYDAGMLRKPMSREEAMKKIGAMYSGKRAIVSDVLSVLGYKD